MCTSCMIFKRCTTVAVIENIQHAFCGSSSIPHNYILTPYTTLTGNLSTIWSLKSGSNGAYTPGQSYTRYVVYVLRTLIVSELILYSGDNNSNTLMWSHNTRRQINLVTLSGLPRRILTYNVALTATATGW